MGKVLGLQMRASDIDPVRTNRSPDRTKVLLIGGTQQNQGFVIKKIEMRQYIERKDESLGDYSLLTVTVDTDKGGVEMKYDALDSAVAMLTQYVGLASLINRALIELQR
jgi:hypothetical protein